MSAFLAAIGVIIATSVGLASADSRSSKERSAAAGAAAAAKVVEAAKQPAPARAASSTSIATVAPAAAMQQQARTRRQLPFTGEPMLDRVLIAGAGLLLVGMLVQVAGQPLPARHPAR